MAPVLLPWVTATWVGEPRRLDGFCLGGLGRAGRARGALRLGHPGAEHVGADHRDRGQHEDPEDREVGDPDQEVGQLRHRGRRPSLATIRTVIVVVPTLTCEPSRRVARGHLAAVDADAVGRAEVVDLDERVLAARGPG